jgi:hypothetical protein
MKNSLSVVVRMAALTGCLMVVSGCASSYQFKVDAVSNQAVEMGTGSYRITCANPEMDEQDIRFQEAAGFVKTALSSKGMYEAPAGIEPDMAIELDFGMEGPIEVVEYREMGGLPVPLPVDPANGRISDRNGAANVNYVAKLNAVSVPVVVSYYDKYIRITAREDESRVEGDRAPRTAWSLLVGNRDKNADLREYLPLLVSAGMDAMGSETERNEKVVLSQKDNRVLFVKNGL